MTEVDGLKSVTSVCEAEGLSGFCEAGGQEESDGHKLYRKMKPSAGRFSLLSVTQPGLILADCRLPIADYPLSNRRIV